MLVSLWAVTWNAATRNAEKLGGNPTKSGVAPCQPISIPPMPPYGVMWINLYMRAYCSSANKSSHVPLVLSSIGWVGALGIRRVRHLFANVETLINTQIIICFQCFTYLCANCIS